MKNRRRIIAVVLVLALIMSLSACNLITVDEDKDRSRVVATVNGTDITKGEVLDEIAQQMDSYGIPEDYFEGEENAEQYAEIKLSILESLITRVLLLDKAASLELDVFSDEEIANLETEVASFIESNKSFLEMQITQENEALDLTMTEEELANEIQRQFEELLASYSITEDELLDKFKEEQIIYNIQDYLIGDITVTEEEMQDYYDTTLESQEAALKDNPEMMDLIAQVNSVILYDPLPTYYVRHILIATDEEDADLVTEAQNQYYVAETDEEKEAAYAIMEPAFQRIYPTVEEIMNKIAAGEDFDALVESEGDDPGMASYPEGYAVQEGQGQFLEPFENAAIAMTTPGEISEPIKSLVGYHILKLVSITPAGAIPFEDVKSEIEASLLYNKQMEAWDSAIAEWTEAANIVKYEDRLN